MKRLILFILLFSSVLWAKRYFPEIEDSLRMIHPRMRARWLRTKGIEDPYYFKPFVPDSQNVRLVGKWGRGPSVAVAGRDSLVFVALGSEVAIVKITNPNNPQILSEIQAQGLTYKPILKDSFLFIATGRGGVEIWNISNLRNPVFRNRIPMMADIFLKDTFLYAISNDSFKIFSIANIMNPYLIGTCRDSGFTVFVSGNYAYLGDRWGLYILDVSDPRNPVRINTLSDGAKVGAIWVEGNLCYYTLSYPESRFIIANVADPRNPFEVGRLNGVSGGDIYKMYYFVYLPGFDIIDVSDPSFPIRISHLDLPGWENGVWVNNPFGKAFVADDWEGLQIIDISDPTNPRVDTSLLKADYSYDLVVDRNYAYIANYACGLKIIDVSNPTLPREVGTYDTIGRDYIETATARDSFVFMPGRMGVKFKSIDVSDPSRPRLAGISQGTGYIGKDMVIKDSFVYVAEDYKFAIFNVANPRQPRLVGRCNLQNASTSIFLKDTLAYIGSLPSPIINIKDPSNPAIIGSIPEGPYGISVKDTFAYLAINYGGLQIWSVANPSSPYLIDTVYYPRGYDIVINGSFAYFGGLDFRVLNISDPIRPVEVGRYTTPYRVKRIFYSNNLIYAVCFNAGMVILEQLPLGIAEKQTELNKKEVLIITPNPTAGKFSLKTSVKNGLILIYDLTGKLVKKISLVKPRSWLDIKDLPDGVYFIALRSSNNKILTKLIKTKGGKP